MAPVSNSDADSENSFAQAFGAALKTFLESQLKIGQSEAARRLGLKKGGRQRINTYCSPTATNRKKPDAEILYLLCSKLGFQFEYNGYVVSAETFGGNLLAIQPPK